MSASTCGTDGDNLQADAAQLHIPAASDGVLAPTQGRAMAAIADAYGQLVNTSVQAWANKIHQGARYADANDIANYGVTESTAVLQRAEIKVKVKTAIRGAHKQAQIHDRTQFRRQTLRVDASTVAEADILLADACDYAMGALEVPKGVEVTWQRTGSVAIVESNVDTWPIKSNRYEQTCEAYVYTLQACRAPGGHPKADCAYETATTPPIERDVTCRLVAQTWQCEDDNDDAFAPAAAIVQETLNQENH
ncbi:MAG: hypothetical protein EOO38_15205 [Cytophagaceae bacterium]|nr:MAG: hypothetical protein EOO38_15205 [Cytophagaceae bacterium]